MATQGLTAVPSARPQTNPFYLYGGRHDGGRVVAEIFNLGGRAANRRNGAFNRIEVLPLRNKVDPQAVVHVTCQFDEEEFIQRRGYNASEWGYMDGTPGLSNVLQNELAFVTKERVERMARVPQRRDPNEHSVPVWSCWNQLNQSTTTPKFMGLVVHGFHGGTFTHVNPGENPGIVLQVSGSQSVSNTGRHKISAGNTLYWEPPEVDRATKQPIVMYNNDTPSNKFLAAVVDTSVPERIDQIVDHCVAAGQVGDPVREVFADIGGVWLRKFKRAVEDYFANRAADKVKAAVKLTKDLYNAKRAHVIGKANSNSAPGERIDLCLGFTS